MPDAVRKIGGPALSQNAYFRLFFGYRYVLLY